MEVLKKTLKRFGVWIALGFLGILFFPTLASAGQFEVSSTGGYQKKKYSDTDFTLTKNFDASVAYYFWSVSAVEVSYGYIYERDKVGSQDLTYKDQIYSINLVQTLVPRKFPVQPFVRLGVGQLNRKITGKMNGSDIPVVYIDEVTVIMGGGLRIFFSERFAIRSQALSYIEKARFQNWRNNVAISVGLSLFF